MDGATPEATRIVTVQRSQIFRAFANGDSAPADRGGFQSRHSQVWSQVQRAISEIERSGGTACETVRWQQYLVLSRIVGERDFTRRVAPNSNHGLFSKLLKESSPPGASAPS
jgi:hypothetical protein